MSTSDESKQRWQVLKGKTETKRLFDTRRSAHYESVKVVIKNKETIVSVLENFHYPSQPNLDTRSGTSLFHNF